MIFLKKGGWRILSFLSIFAAVFLFQNFAAMYMNESLFNDFLNSREILWTGINFSKAKLTRSAFNFTQEIMQHYFHDWNLLILNDQKKYDIRMSFRKPIMQYDLSVVTKANKNVRVNSVLTERINLKDTLTEESVRAYIPQFTLEAKQRFALTFLVESFDAVAKVAAVWVVIYKTDSGETVLCEQFLKVPSGIGTRNYWARIFYNILYDIKTFAFLRWENMVQNVAEAKDDSDN